MAFGDFRLNRPLPDRIGESALESARFGLRVGRLSVGGRTDETDPAAIGALIERSGLDLVILRYPAEHLGIAADLALRDLVAWQADTLLYFVKSQLVDGDATRPDYRLRRLEPDDPALERAVHEVFEGYGNHYAANPFLLPPAVLAGYAQWARVSAASPHGVAFLLEDSRGDALAVCTLDLEKELAEIALAGVLPQARGRGVYRALLGQVEGWLVAHGPPSVVISTQAGNRTPIRAWIDCGYQFAFALNTAHVMSRQAVARLDPQRRRSSADVQGRMGPR
jgi:GNAT superfamily N-acetyltransferase